jgi:hypothetical protein
MPGSRLDPDTRRTFDCDDAVLQGYIRARFAHSDSPTYETPEFRRRVLEKLRVGDAPVTRERLEQVLDDVSDDYIAEESNVLSPRTMGSISVIAAVFMPSSRPTSLERAARVFATLLAFVPRRIADEEVGDALEVISTFEFQGWRLWLKVVSTIFWVLVNAVREGASATLGKSLNFQRRPIL